MMSGAVEPKMEDKLPTLSMEAEFNKLTGPGYFDILSALHEALAPRAYLEIGTATGLSISLAKCASICVDPKFEIQHNAIGTKPEVHFFQKTSDSFFSSNIVKSLLKEISVDFAFLDGMHLFEFLLRDFINTERVCTDKAIIALHDCVPADVFMTTRSRNDDYHRRSSKPHWWTGDVWKVICILKRYRPSLDIVTVGAPPTGLVLVSNLQPSNNDLSDNYEEIIAEFKELDLETYGFARFLEEAEAQDSEKFCDVAFLRNRYGLSV